ncbi:hypothetical protein T4B_11284 [Trichinella pseudospiralis]|nr:hypothetical protein T4B_11284 [Trichinella pseudospiralis]KRZ43211.1 hypothetical protein T4C_10007 [Trichinella pseudospiralis]
MRSSDACSTHSMLVQGQQMTTNICNLFTIFQALIAHFHCQVISEVYVEHPVVCHESDSRFSMIPTQGGRLQTTVKRNLNNKYALIKVTWGEIFVLVGKSAKNKPIPIRLTMPIEATVIKATGKAFISSHLETLAATTTMRNTCQRQEQRSKQLILLLEYF